MFQGFLVTAIFFGGKLAGALVKLRGHLGRFFGGAAESDENFGQIGKFHG